MAQLFPDEDPVEILRIELLLLTVEDYIKTVKDRKCPYRDDMRVFGKKYSAKDVYVKIRVELTEVTNAGEGRIFVMSFHFAKESFCEADFPYRRLR